MKYVRFISLLFAACLLLVAPMATQAQTILDAARLSVIQQRCAVLQTSLDQLRRRDLVARTDHGHEYENIIRQINAFATRLDNNDIPSSAINTPANDFKEAVSDFRQVYIRYDDSITALRQTDCQTRTADFARLLEETRVLRAELGAEVTNSEEALLQYRQAMLALRSTLPVEVAE